MTDILSEESKIQEEKEDEDFLFDLMNGNIDDDCDDNDLVMTDEIINDAKLVAKLLNKSKLSPKSSQLSILSSLNDDIYCSVCLAVTKGSEQQSCKITTKCGHSVCTECYKRLLNICFCDKIEGQIIYCCPMCRDLTKYTNQEMYKILGDMGTDTLYTVPHLVCKESLGCPNFVRKCIFKKCGCRIQTKDVVMKNLTNLTFEQIIANYFT